MNEPTSNGPLNMFLELIEKEHFQAAKDVVHLVKESLATLQPPSADDGQVVVKELAEKVGKLAEDVNNLHNLLLSLSEPKLPQEPATEPEEETPA